MSITKKEALRVLVSSAIVGQSKGAYAIKDASYIYQQIKIVSNPEVKPEEEKIAFESLVRAVLVANQKGAYTLEEADVINTTIDFLSKEGLIVINTPTKEEPKKLEKIEEVTEV
jgi:hypothetical protein